MNDYSSTHPITNEINNFSFVNEDVGYKAMNVYHKINKKFPFKDDIEPRLVRYLRIYYFYKIYNIKPCVPLIMEYWIRQDDINCINKYLHKYGIGL